MHTYNTLCRQSPIPIVASTDARVIAQQMNRCRLPFPFTHLARIPHPTRSVVLITSTAAPGLAPLPFGANPARLAEALVEIARQEGASSLVLFSIDHGPGTDDIALLMEAGNEPIPH